MDTDPKRATRDDIPSILALERQTHTLAHWSEQSYRAIFEPDASSRTVLVSKEKGTLRGFLVARFNGTECELENIVVSIAERRRGLASQLLNSLIAAAAERRADKILLEVRESNAAARGLYEKFGFRQLGRRKSYYSGPQEDALQYALSLAE